MGLENVWRSWFAFRKGKSATNELNEFQYSLEKNLQNLYVDLRDGTYKHGGYKKFIVCDNKKREISVASVRDRVVHRLVYDYLVEVYDKTFIYDAWSCRKGKGLLGAIERAQSFLASDDVKYPLWFWKCDVRKFFDNVNHEILLNILERRVKDEQAFGLLREIVGSFQSKCYENKAIPIGNLTSQIFSNIYLNELDRFVKHELKVKRYLRYGDDFIVIDGDAGFLKFVMNETESFLERRLKLFFNFENYEIRKVGEGVKFLGVVLYPSGRKLNRRNWRRIRRKLNFANAGSYWGLVKKHETKRMHELYWAMKDI